MALKKPTFEQEPSTESDVAVAEAPETQTQPEPAVVTSTAIAKAAASSVVVDERATAAAAAKLFKKQVEAMEDAADMSWGTHRVFKAKDGVIREMANDKLLLGRWVKVRLLAWSRHWEISPGAEGSSASAFVGYSKDSLTIDYVIGEEYKGWEGKPVKEYLTYLRETEEFQNAGVREFIDCQCAVLGSEEEPDFHEIVQITLSSSSIPAFKRYQSDLEAKARCVELGLPGFSLPQDPFTFYFIREGAEKGKMTWTKLKIASSLPAKI